ncbi:unnamed protein product [Linum trigynum]|uniref:AB hydrolase-1 domain-containing protein n=1 Tax=Linum trigynum TaxID=586398 RepID=A0AAV2EXU7_9ROSI
MNMASIQFDIRAAINAANLFFVNHDLLLPRRRRLSLSPRPFPSFSSYGAAAASPTPSSSLFRLRASFSSGTSEPAIKLPEKPPICSADELHYVTIPNSDWRLALWRYHPSPQAPPRNHPLLLLSGVGTNAIGYDLSPGSSFARYMSGQGYDTWILEVRGAGLSVRESDAKNIGESAYAASEHMESAAKGVTTGSLTGNQATAKDVGQYASEQMGSVAKSVSNGAPSANQETASAAQSTSPSSELSSVPEDPTGLSTVWDESMLVSKLTDTFMTLSESLSGFLSEGQSMIMSAKLFDQISTLLEDTQLSERLNELREKLLSLLETRENSGVASQIRDLSQTLVNIVEEGQKSVSPQLFDLHDRLTSTVEDFQKQLDLIVKYDWDFDHYLEEDVPTAMQYIKAECKPKDGKLLAIGHSMGGILLYARTARSGFEGNDSGFAAIVTLASSVDYTTSNSRLKLLVPLADPAQALNVPVVPLGAILAAAFPLSSRPPYVLSWLNNLISAQDMMHPELLEKLVLNNFCTIPAKLLLQLTTAFREGGLRDRSGKFLYKDHLHKCNIPVLALAGDQDLICPPEAVEETVKVLPEHLVTYKVFGESGGPHYAHYDLVGGQLAVEQVYPAIVEFLSQHDSV